VGTSTVASIASTFGLPGPIPEEPSMALGTLSASPLDVAAAFTPFANLGARTEPRAIVRVEGEKGDVLHEAAVQSRPVLDPAVAYVIDDVLQDALNRGTGTAVRASGYRAAAAGKTGTTNDGADAWFVGWTPDVVAVVWIGFDKPQQILRKATGGRVAAPVWARVMSQYYRGRAPKPWANPGGVTSALVDPATGFVIDPTCPYGGPTTRELFVGTTPNPVCPQTLDPALYAGGLPPGYVIGADGVVIGPDGQPIDTEAGFDPDFAAGDAAWPTPPQPPGDGEESGMVSYTPSSGRTASPDTRPASQGDSRIVPTAPQQPLNPSPDVVGRPAASPHRFEEASPRPRAQPSVEAVPLGGHPPEDEPEEDEEPPPEEPSPEPPIG
jgi:membrane peptidoglycan carboxypeptidase